MSNINPYAPAPAPVIPLRFTFDGGAGTYIGVAILSLLVSVLTLGLGVPWAISMRYRWQCQHTIINGQRLRFTGSGLSLFGHYVKWWALCIVTLGIYTFWVAPRLTRWVVEHQEGVLQIQA